MIQPDELKKSEPLKWSTGIGTDVWELFCAAIAGDLAAVIRLVTKDPSSGPQPLHLPDAALLRRARESARGGRVPARPRGRSDRPGRERQPARDLPGSWLCRTWKRCWQRKLERLHGASPKGEAIGQAIRERDLPAVRRSARRLARAFECRRPAFQSTDPLGRDDQAARSDRRAARTRSRYQRGSPGRSAADPAHQRRLPLSRLARRSARTSPRRPPRCSSTFVPAAPTSTSARPRASATWTASVSCWMKTPRWRTASRSM